MTIPRDLHTFVTHLLEAWKGELLLNAEKRDQLEHAEKLIDSVEHTWDDILERFG